MDYLITFYTSLFPGTELIDWFLALVGFALYHLLKIKHVPLSELCWSTWKNDNAVSVIISIITVLLCLSCVPVVYAEYSTLDSLLIGFSSTNIIKQFITKREQKISNSL